MACQSAICLSSSCRLFGGRNDGLVLLRTFSRALGPTERVGRWRGPFCEVRGDFGASGSDEEGGMIEGTKAGAEGERDEVDADAWFEGPSGTGVADEVGVGKD